MDNMSCVDHLNVKEQCISFATMNDTKEGDDLPSEISPKSNEMTGMVQQLNALAVSQETQLHSLISELDSQLAQCFVGTTGVSLVLTEMDSNA